MTLFDDEVRRIIRRNKLRGILAAQKLGLLEAAAAAYSDALAMDALDPDRSDVLGRIRKDFDAAGVVQSDEQILVVMNEFLLQAGDPQAMRSDGIDGAAVTIAKNLQRR